MSTPIVAEARGLIRALWERKGIAPVVDDDGDLTCEYSVPLADGREPRTCFLSTVVTDMGPGRVSVSVVSGFNQPFPTERYWDTLDFINKINATNETGVAYVVGEAEGMFGLLAKTLWAGDVVTEMAVGYPCGAVMMEMKNIIHPAAGLWAGDLTVASALETYWSAT